MQDSEHRKELVAGNLEEHAIAGEYYMQLSHVILKSPLHVQEYTRASDSVGDDDVNWIDLYTNRLSPPSFSQYLNLWILTHIPEVRAHPLSSYN